MHADTFNPVNLKLYRDNPARGPRIVVIGGGTGLSTMLRGLKRYTQHICAVCTVADNGGSSGLLRKDLGILPPGDIRNCILALADTEPVMEKLMNHRFSEGSLNHQNFGNLFIAAMTEVCDGNFYEAVRKFSDVLAVTGKVLPVSLQDLNICAHLSDGRFIIGESAIGHEELPAGVRITDICMDPATATALPEVLEEIRQADLVVLGPGSLYTSIIPNLLFKEVREAIIQSAATTVYVCNIMTQPAETRGYNAQDHLRAILDACGKTSAQGLIDYCIVNNEPLEDSVLGVYKETHAETVFYDRDSIRQMGTKLIEANLVLIKNGKVRHDAAELAVQLMQLAHLAAAGKHQSASASPRLCMPEAW
ncbi:YvcK family protein [Oscillospiraceae bacterium HV4-5-C5C]|nr:YvcK family protein [Oscillospiraceae bacterium HV4-5-C5C]